MEHLDFPALVRKVYPHLLNQTDRNLVSRAIRAMVDAYPFPSNLDLDPPCDDWLGELETNWLFHAWKTKRTPSEVISDYTNRRNRRFYRSA
jgi:hypothetical protein